MGSNGTTQNGSNFVLTGDALHKALPDMGMATRAVHADDFVTPHRAIAPGMHVAVNFRYARDPDHLVPEENKDVSNQITSEPLSPEHLPANILTKHPAQRPR
jgi:hypothetical protein